MTWSSPRQCWQERFLKFMERQEDRQIKWFWRKMFHLTCIIMFIMMRKEVIGVSFCTWQWNESRRHAWDSIWKECIILGGYMCCKALVWGGVTMESLMTGIWRWHNNKQSKFWENFRDISNEGILSKEIWIKVNIYVYNSILDACCWIQN
jgi:hypothetical protein